MVSAKSTFELENDQILEFVLDNYFFDDFKHGANWPRRGIRKGLELFITPDCNQKCEYCYLPKYKESLYPAALRNPKNILHNMDILFDYLVERGCKCIPCIDLFSGEIWQTQFGIDVLKKLLENIKRSGITVPEICILPAFWMRTTPSASKI